MSRFGIILVIIISLALKVILISVFVILLNLKKEISETHLLLHEDLLQIQLSLNKVETQEILKDFENKNRNQAPLNSNTITELRSSSVSKSELEQLMKGKELAFKKEINIKPGEMFINTDIEI